MVWSNVLLQKWNGPQRGDAQMQSHQAAYPEGGERMVASEAAN